MATVGIAGVVLAVDKPDLWFLVIAIALVPAAIANWLWNRPEATLSQLIAQARSRP